MPHDFHDEHTSVGVRRRMDAVDDIRRDADRALETKGHVRAPQIVVDRLGEGDDMGWTLER